MSIDEAIEIVLRLAAARMTKAPSYAPPSDVFEQHRRAMDIVETIVLNHYRPEKEKK